jgi:hypothetical protein
MLPLKGINPWSFARIKENTINQSIYDIAIAVAVRNLIYFNIGGFGQLSFLSSTAITSRRDSKAMLSNSNKTRFELLLR